MENKREAGNIDSNDISWMYCYGDIKFNILVEHNHKSMIVELQFLLNMMYVMYVNTFL